MGWGDDSQDGAVGEGKKGVELLRTLIRLIEGTVGVEGWEVGALDLNTGWFCSQSHSDTDGKNKHFQVTGPPGVGGEGEEEAAH